MSITKFPKIVYVFGAVLVLAAAWGGFLAYKNYQDEKRFKPYRQLAQDINNALGGGFTITEFKHCGLEGGKCPRVALAKTEQINFELEAKSRAEKIVIDLDKIGANVDSSGRCNKTEDIGYCFVKASKYDLKIVIDVKDTGIGVDIYR